MPRLDPSASQLTNLSVTAIIPARLDSIRFPRKALADDTGTPLVVHVCERAAAATSVARVVVATDAQEIADAVIRAGFDAVLTGQHENGTARLAEAADNLALAHDHIIVNVQGDEPEIEPETIDAAITSLHVAATDAEAQSCRSPNHATCADVGTVVSPFAPGEDPANPNVVKAVVGAIEPSINVGRALFFSRAPIPYNRDMTDEPGARPLKHIGIYAYAVRSLQRYVQLPPTPLEMTERLEQLRWLESGYSIAAAIRPAAHAGIDTPEQYALFVRRFNQARSQRA